MLKLSVAFLLVALALSASARPSYIKHPAFKYARLSHTALKPKAFVDTDDVPVSVQHHDNNVVVEEDDEDSADDTDDFERELDGDAKEYERQVMKFIVQATKEAVLKTIPQEHRHQIEAIFNKYPEPDYNSESSVDRYFEKVFEDAKVYAEAHGLYPISEEELD